MNKVLLVLLSVLGMVACKSRNDHEVSVDQLPKPVQSFVSAYFPEESVRKVKLDKNKDGGMDYYVYMEKGAKLEFDRNGEWNEMKGRPYLPENLVPADILAYVNTHFTGQKIRKITKLTKSPVERYRVVISTGAELFFDQEHKFVRMREVVNYKQHGLE